MNITEYVFAKYQRPGFIAMSDAEAAVLGIPLDIDNALICMRGLVADQEITL